MISGGKVFSTEEYSRSVSALLSGQAAHPIPSINIDESSFHREEIHFSRPPITYTVNIPWLTTLYAILDKPIQSGLIKNSIIHGSYGDNTTTPFSDLEITLFLNDDILTSKSKARILASWVKKKLNPLLLRIDPLQHHSAFYIWQGLLDAYNQDILPLSAYKYAWAIKDETIRVKCHHQKTTESLKLRYTSTAKKIIASKKNFFSYGVSPYAIKRLISNFVLLPAFYYQAKGMQYSKSDSLKKIRQLEIHEINEALDLATAIRSEWPVSPYWLGVARGAISKQSIPSGRVDLILSSLYKNQQITDRYIYDLHSKISLACYKFLELLEV